MNIFAYCSKRSYNITYTDESELNETPTPFLFLKGKRVCAITRNVDWFFFNLQLCMDNEIVHFIWP